MVFQVELRQSTKFMERFRRRTSGILRLIRETIADGQQAAPSARNQATTAAKIFFGALDEMATNWMLSRRRYGLTPKRTR